MSMNGTKWSIILSYSDLKSRSHVVLHCTPLFRISPVHNVRSIICLFVYFIFYLGRAPSWLALFSILRIGTLFMLVTKWNHEKTINHSILPHELKQNTKQIVMFDGLKVAHKQFTLEWWWNTTYRYVLGKNPCVTTARLLVPCFSYIIAAWCFFGAPLLLFRWGIGDEARAVDDLWHHRCSCEASMGFSK